MKFTLKELRIVKNALSEILEIAYKSINISNAKELALSPVKDFNNDIDVTDIQSALKKVIEEIVNAN